MTNEVVALAGNPNTGKSTLFNRLTGLRQHTGNWPGKTVGVAMGQLHYNERTYELVDLPGTYSLLANSAEEEVARDFLWLHRPEVAVVVTDATNLERNLNLVLQVMEVLPNTVVCVNLMDEARRKGLYVDLRSLAVELGVPAVGISARTGEGVNELVAVVDSVARENHAAAPTPVRYSDALEKRIQPVQAALCRRGVAPGEARWVALRLLEGEKSVLSVIRPLLEREEGDYREYVAARAAN